jgi:MOSC domain-containing protein YiiM
MSDWREIGKVVRLQVQREPLKASGVYEPRYLLSVERAVVGAAGMLGREGDAWVVDAHHTSHPRARGGGNRALSIGFTGHYAAMEDRFGSVAYGVAGENVIVAGQPLRMSDISGGLLVRRSDDEEYELRTPRPAAPCREFTSYLLRAPHVLDRSELQDEFEFLSEGTRGFIVDVSHLAELHQIALGDTMLARA